MSFLKVVSIRYLCTRARTQTDGLTENLIKTFRVTRCVHDEYSRDAADATSLRPLYLYLTATHCDVRAFKRKRKENITATIYI